MLFLLFIGVQYWFHNTVYKKQLRFSEGGIGEELEFVIYADRHRTRTAVMSVSDMVWQELRNIAQW